MSLVGGTDVQTLARALGTNMSLGTTTHAFERDGELLERWFLGFFGPQSYSFDEAGPGALDVGLEHVMGFLPADQLERVTTTKTVTLKPVTQRSGVRGATFVDPVSGEDVYVEYRDGKGRDAGTAYTSANPQVLLDELVHWEEQRDCEREHGVGSASCSGTHVFQPGVRVYHLDDERNATTIGLPRGFASQGTLQAGDVLTGPGGRYSVAVTALSAGSATVKVEVLAPAADDPAPGDPAPGDPTPGDPAPGDPTPGDPGPVDLVEARLLASASGSTYGTPATVDVSVETAQDAAHAEGDVVVLDGRKQLATATLTGGTARVALPADLPAGTHELTVRYGGSGTVAPTEASVRVRVKKAKPTVSAQVPTAVRGTRTKVRIVVDSALAPRGKVAVFLDGTKRKTLRLKDGGATYRLPKKFAPGRHTLRVRFLGADGFKKSALTTKVRVWRSVAKVKGFATGTKRVQARSVYRDKVRLSDRGIVQRRTAKGWKRVATLRPGRSTPKVRAGKQGSVRKYRVVIKKRGHVKGVRTKPLTLHAR